MTYHQIKMEEINKIIKEYWQQTYKGNDIDTIEIRSDCESGRSNTFQYKVMMIKGEVELEMRGRVKNKKLFLFFSKILIFTLFFF